jgi:pyruvate/2-oxoglutarate/acetoin dehydrogenase E1 component
MMTYLASIQTGLRQAFAEDPRVCLLGEDVLDPYGGAFKATKGLSSAFPDRVFTTPISEGAITGVASGLALAGFRPVVEIMFGDFLTLCCDQIVNHMAKFGTMYGTPIDVPVVLRTPMGGGRGYGATHSQSLEKLFLGVPGLRVVAPSHAHDPGAILKHAILADGGPVIFIEHKLLYAMDLLGLAGGLGTERRDEDAGYPTMIVRNHDGEPDVTVIAYGGVSRLLVPLIAELADEEIAVDAVFPASIRPLPADTLAVCARRSGRVLVVEEGTQGFNWGSEVAAVLSERLFGKLAAPIRRVASRDSVIPASAEGEGRMLVGKAEIEAAILDLLA